MQTLMEYMFLSRNSVLIFFEDFEDHKGLPKEF